MVKILHYGLSENLGGIETYLIKLNKKLSSDHLKFDFVILGDKYFEGYQELLVNDSQIYFVTPRRKSILNNFFETRKLFKNNSYDLIHFHLLSLSDIMPIVLAKFYKIPVVIHSHSSNCPDSKITKLLHDINKKIIHFFDFKGIAVSKLAAEWLFNKNDNVEVINNGINIEQFQFNEEKRSLTRTELGLTDELMAIHIGTLKEVKNPLFVVEIFNEMLKINKNCKLYFVGGDGELRDEVNAKINRYQIENKIEFLGFRTDIPNLLSAADVLIFPSLYEGFPGTVLEAETNGLPCVISENITEEVQVSDQCLRLSLKLPAKNWAREVLSNKPISERQYAVNDILNSDLTDDHEAQKLRAIYNEVLDK
ncbi:MULTISPECIES: glycosyltransferase [Aerococcus]|uniref:Glycosyltransferase family 1 protein n=1 Tax=Aerococcus sanguinicola TaxID=119206 RepID=A0A5N1GP82_9LACT|nr:MULTISPECIES: glycosyltransferase [Aerococcus]KAA9302214.1 glycosyltransferase family 1 protein [Aerococcus sanguinicola]MDK6368357.1 glycosyltransferase [Aerococcus sp. UMB9870]MDK6679439.1 glycosyltransferase [Aerococcus sp. UMB8608]MDK6687204.1 glycosyltransferase [Aerococcus sp. UMB8623]MDK6941097.1 glycosyltransferase [Aerococcus sp. UMB8487]